MNHLKWIDNVAQEPFHYWIFLLEQGYFVFFRKEFLRSWSSTSCSGLPSKIQIIWGAGCKNTAVLSGILRFPSSIRRSGVKLKNLSVKLLYFVLLRLKMYSMLTRLLSNQANTAVAFLDFWNFSSQWFSQWLQLRPTTGKALRFVWLYFYSLTMFTILLYISRQEWE